MRLSFLLGAAALPMLLGCHSAFIDATVSNRTPAPISLIEVDYPSASFGTEDLAPGKDFHYRFKVLGSGPLKVVYTDSTRQEKKAQGPLLEEGAEGPLSIVFTTGGVQWQAPPPKPKR